MGTVYEAVRVDKEFTKRVAIKVVKRGMDTDFVLRRFRKERQILAALSHSNIASLLDGGTTNDGLPYFVMEYIDGKPLYEYCDANRLSIAERLHLFLSVCDAVDYAHQKHVIHRDIKPSNVLVTAEGIPKLLLFARVRKFSDPWKPDLDVRVLIGKNRGAESGSDADAPEPLNGGRRFQGIRNFVSELRDRYSVVAATTTRKGLKFFPKCLSRSSDFSSFDFTTSHAS